MAAGNRGITLIDVAPVKQGHKSHMLQQAAANLDVAINDHERVIRYGGQTALDIFERARAKLSVSNNPHGQIFGAAPQLDNPYLSWCLRQGLFLHFSPECIQSWTGPLDSVSFRSIELKFSDGSELVRAENLSMALTSIKQSYITARYLTWLATEESPIREEARKITKYTTFWDTFSYGHWGCETWHRYPGT